MPEQQRGGGAVIISDFGGIATAVDRDDLADGLAESQVNLTCEYQGQMRTRPGYREVTFESGA